MNYLFSYSGPVSFKIKRQLLRNIKSGTEAVTKSILIQKRIRYVFDEIISNVYEYYKQNNLSSETTSIDGYLKNNTLEFVLNSTVSEADKETLKTHLDYINSLDEEGLKNLYKKRLEDKNTEKANAGIGLISIRIKTGNLITYEFKKILTADTVLLKIVLNLKDE
ncbi:MAG TPA: DUF6272 family protein [Bacteroidia bacterium]|nr:DUF6272 family protein [Bacteroidia bacterium]